MTYLKNLSFKIKTILGIALIESFLLALIYFTSINSLNETNENQITTRANETSSLISLWVRNSLLTYDVGNTEHFIASLVQGEGLVYIHVKRDDGKTFAYAGDPKYKKIKIVNDLTLKQAQQDGVFDTSRAVLIDGMEIGKVEIGLSVAKLSEFIDNVSYEIKIIAIIEVFLSGLFSLFLGWMLTRRLETLKEAVIKVQQTGEMSLVGDDAKDEIGLVSQAFDSMSQNLLETQSKLKLNALKLEKVFNSTPDGMVVIGNNGLILSINPAFMGIVNCHTFFDGRSYEFFIEVFDKLIDTNDFLSVNWLNQVKMLEDLYLLDDSEISIQFAKPNYRYLKVSHQLVKDSDSGIHSIFYFRDLTKSQDVDRLKSEFLAHAAHELRTPLTSVQGFSELLKQQNMDDDIRIELADIINIQAKRVVDMVGELLDIAKIEAGGVRELNLTALNLETLIEKVVNEFSVPENRSAVQLHIDPRSIPKMVDESRIYQIVLNLISNAYKYSQAPSLISLYVEAFNFDVDGQASVGMQIRVVDFGMGMTEMQLEQLFDRFWRADISGAIPGTGLGMSLVKELVALHGGEIKVNSVFGEGTEVIVQFFK